MHFSLQNCVTCRAVSNDGYSRELKIDDAFNLICANFILTSANLIDADASGLISGPQFTQMGLLFNFDYNSIHNIFHEFDVSGDKNLDFVEFWGKISKHPERWNWVPNRRWC